MKSQKRRDYATGYIKLRELIEDNFQSDGQHWVLTFREPPLTQRELNRTVRLLMRRAQYALGLSLRYINVDEYNRRRPGFHAHVVVAREDGQPFRLTRAHLAAMWPHGFVYVREIKEVEAIANYLTNERKRKSAQRNGLQRAFHCSQNVTRRSLGEKNYSQN